jgi:hypothetical protein
LKIPVLVVAEVTRLRFYFRFRNSHLALAQCHVAQR